MFLLDTQIENDQTMNTDRDFRETVRYFLDVMTPQILESTSRGAISRAQAWRAALFDFGLAAFGYPATYGGNEDPLDALIWNEESQGKIPREDNLFGIGVGMAMPVIRDYASKEVKDRFLRPGLRGEEVWCQMYSEPGAGSDLAGLTTRAELDGDEWVVTGQKVWTSGAQNSQYAILLARTDFDAPKHSGITMFVLPMKQTGVDIQPLIQMTGEAEFNQIFIQEARIPRGWVVGEVNDGWRMAVALLAHERVRTGQSSTMGDSTQRSKSGRVPIPSRQLIELAHEKGRIGEAVVRQELATLVTGERIIEFIRRRNTVHPSIGKLWRTRQGRAAADFAARMCFPASPAWSSDQESEDYFQFHILNCRGMSLGGGTDEIQRNTLGERALGLPREPGPARDTPFRALPRN